MNIGYNCAIIFRGLFMLFAFMSNISLMLITLLLNGFCTGPLMGSLNALIAASSDYTNRKKVVRLDGMMYSCSSFGIKVRGGSVPQWQDGFWQLVVMTDSCCTRNKRS